MDTRTQNRPVRDRRVTAEECARAVVDKVGKDIRLALPLGVGKANHFANAIYDLAKADKSVRLHIFTALTLTRPHPAQGLEARFAGPLVEKLFGDYPELHYAQDRAAGQVPPNIEIEEFFLATGQLTSNTYAQRHYNSVNYTHALRRLIRQRVNVLGQMIAVDPRGESGRFSLSCNTDLSLELIPRMRSFFQNKEKVAIIGEINLRLPFMPNDAIVDGALFDMMIEPAPYDLAGPPAARVDAASYAIGLHAAQLVRDGGTLQIGIGSTGDGAAQALKLRHENNSAFEALCEAIGGQKPDEPIGNSGAFGEGLYGCTEMFTQGMFELMRVGVIRRAPHPGTNICLDAGFFLGPQEFYRDIREADDALLNAINMTAVETVNSLYGDEMARRSARKNARFINIGMKATCLGAVASDALEDGRVISGVGGQYNFVAQAHELEGARSIILMRAVREKEGEATSNIVWSYGHTTVPRHLRDVIVTEYGVADLRGETDETCVKRMIAIADSRFQDSLLAAARSVGKIDPDFTIPDAWRNNTPDRIVETLRGREGDLPPFPFGTEMDDAEQRLALALPFLKAKTSRLAKAALFAISALGARAPSAGERTALERVGLLDPKSLKDALMSQMLKVALRRTS